MSDATATDEPTTDAENAEAGAEAAPVEAAPPESRPVSAARENLYEGMFLVDSGKFANDPDGITAKIIEIVETAGGNVVLHRPWSDGKLAYPIGNHRKGLHYVVYFKMNPRGNSEITRSCKLSDTIIRHMIIKQPATLFDAMVAALTPAEESAEAPAE